LRSVIVVSILAPDLATLRARALAQAPFADAIELRLDELAHATLDELRALIASTAKPVIAAVNSADAFGTFAGTREQRFALLERAARAGAAFVDVDWKEGPHQPPVPPPCRRIVSRHVLDETPLDLAGAFEAVAAAASRPGDLPKFVTHAAHAEDGVRLLEFAGSLSRDLVAFASGERGSFTRVLAPAFGSRLTYAAPARVAGFDVGRATAPGQLRADELRALLPAAGLSRTTEIYGVLGLPARHSLSPRLHNAVFRALGRDAVYVALEPENLRAFAAGLLSPRWRGFSVTAPFKEDAFALADQNHGIAQASGSTNTLLRAGRLWMGHNTDVAAIGRVLSDGMAAAGLAAADARALVVGTGGAARAAVWAAKARGITQLALTSRSDDKAEGLARELGLTAIAREALASERFDVILHCTPAGSRTAPNEIAVPLATLRNAQVVVEAVYRPQRTPLVEAAAAAGAQVVLGKEWFLEQAVEQALHFSPEGASARAVMQAELERALAEDES
jgi:shikimate dehydrogenase/3-dehydroquinate dehydratase type I